MQPPPILRLGTRASLLARTQSQLVAGLLAPHLPTGQSIQLVPLTTSGDRLSASQPAGASAQSAKGLFTRELDAALLAGSVDFTVHSAKDLPGERPAGIALAATPPREDPRDVWISRHAIPIGELPAGARVGTVSTRRAAQLLALRPDLLTIPLRGNIDTRLRKVAEGYDDLAATFLAAAGLLRTGLLPSHAQLLPTDQFVPAAGQGTLAIEARAADSATLALLAHIHDPITAACLAFERRLLADLAGDCLAPIGVVARPRGIVDGQRQPGWLVRAIVATLDGKRVARAALMAQDDDPGALAALSPLLLRTLESRGAREILAASHHPIEPSDNAPVPSS